MGALQLVAVAALLGAVLFAIYALRTDALAAVAARRTLRRPATWLVGGTATVLVLAVGVPFVYLRLASGPGAKPLTFAALTPGPTTTLPLSAPSVDGATTARASTAFADRRAHGVGPAGTSRTVGAASPTAGSAGVDSSIAGQWSVGAGSQAGYSIDDTAMGQTQRVVGRTSDVSGAMAIVGSTVTSTRAVVNMRTVTCHCVHDTRYRQLMETDRYPTSMFELTKPISLAAIPAQGAVTTVPITGNFTLHGVTRSVNFSLKATRLGARIAVNGSIPIKLSDYNIQSPNAGAMGGLSNCDIDLLIAFDRTG